MGVSEHCNTVQFSINILKNLLWNRPVFISDSNNKGMDTLVLSMNVELGKDNGKFSMDCRVCNPILLSLSIWRIDDKLIGLGIKDGRCFHFHGIVSIGQFGQGKTSNHLVSVDPFQERSVTSGSQIQHRAAKQIEQHRQLGGHTAVDQTGNLVNSKNVQWIALKIKN